MLGNSPCYKVIDVPSPTASQGQVKVIAVGVRVNVVGKLSNGEKVYFIATTPPNRSMSARINVDQNMLVPLSEAADFVVFADTMSPGLRSCFALRERVHIQHVETILILDITENLRQLAAASAQLLDAKCVISVERNSFNLYQLFTDDKIDSFIILNDDETQFQQVMQKEAADVGIKINDLW
ncbi:unnamed protein product [Rotaria magnacalcarata]|uniref:Uncharacterized protein n=1 Tax=Rotaria magnacalcarata TaxID=392030 RepID=A0A816UV19_9BILA|nr:unnamed protein product [Rotaria magnacalcarata]CAF4255978.1 unnamed protein product [Rotaria magnacalcarata]